MKKFLLIALSFFVFLSLITVIPSYANCNSNNDCNGTGKPYCIGGNCKDCRNDSDCNNPANYCNANNSCAPRPATPTPIPQTTPTPTPAGNCNSTTGRPNNCSCNDNSKCASGYCHSPSNGGFCEPAYCNVDSGRPNGCDCNDDNKCASGYCQSPNNGGMCTIAPTAPREPTLTPTLEPGPIGNPPTPTAIPNQNCDDKYKKSDNKLTSDTNLNNGTTTFHNDYNCDMDVGIASFKIYNVGDKDEQQEVFDYKHGVVKANGNLSLNIQVPNCKYQVDTFVGFLGDRRGVDNTDPSGRRNLSGPSCGPLPTPTPIITAPPTPRPGTPAPTSGVTNFPTPTSVIYPTTPPGGSQTGFVNISGCVYNDLNGDGHYSVGDTPYTGSFQISITGGYQPTYTGDGCYSYSGFAAIPTGNYVLQLQSLSGTYQYTFPSGRSYSIAVFPPYCAVLPNNPTGNDWTCRFGSLANLNFGINSNIPWFQTADYNIRNDQSGFNNPIPSTSACGTVAIRNGTGGTTGVVYYGNNSNNFGNGSASGSNWLVGGSNSLYTSPGMTLRTSYASTLQAVTRNKQTPTALSSYCTTTNCAITDTIGSAPYIVSSGNLTLNTVTITTKKVIIFVNGDLHVTQPVQVAKGAFLMFVVKGSIYMDPTVGRTAGTYACPGGTTQVDGIYSADGNVIISGETACPTGDKQLNVSGSIVTNANLISGGQLINNRSLCAANAQYPSLTIQPRLDFLFSIPGYVMNTTSNWQEVAP